MRIALITYEFPYPANSGFRLRIHQQVNLLSRLARGDLFVLSYVQPELGSRNFDTPRLQGACREARIVHLPEESMLAKMTRYVCSALTLRNPIAYKFLSHLNSQEILCWLRTVRPNLVVLETPFLAELIPHIRHMGFLVAVDTINVEAELARQLYVSTKSRQARLRYLVFWIMTQRTEQNFLHLSDEIWAVSEEDIKRFRKFIPMSVPITLVPNAVNTESYSGEWTEEPNAVVFIGPYSPPNARAAEVLLKKIWPQVRVQCQGAKLYLVGRDPTRFMVEAATRTHDVFVTGQVDDAKSLIGQAAIVVVPLSEGSGTRFKILEAMAMGKPVVSTPKGCEGLEVENGYHLLIRDLDYFAGAIVELLNNSEARRRLGRQGRQLIKERYSWEAVEDILKERIQRYAG